MRVVWRKFNLARFRDSFAVVFVTADLTNHHLIEVQLYVCMHALVDPNLLNAA